MQAASSNLSANLRRLRLSKELSQEALAVRAGLTRVAYTRIETGQAQPRGATVGALARALVVPLSDLLAKPVELTGVRFRSFKRLRTREAILHSVSRRLHDLAELEEVLDERSEFDVQDLQLTGSGPSKAVKAAHAVRVRFGLSDTEPLRDIFGLAESHGATVLTLPIDSESFFGLSIAPDADRRRGAVIVVNVAPHISVERCLFSAAHELGHLVLHHQDYRQDEVDENKAHEKEADTFAAHLLMPQAAFEREWAKYSGLRFVERVLAVKAWFGVSYKTVLYRLYELGRRNAFVEFQAAYARDNGKGLKAAEEPAAMERSKIRGASHGRAAAPEPVEDFAGDELRSLRSRSLFVEPRVHRLVRGAVEAKAISLSRAAEILGISLVEMRSLANAWVP